MGEVVLHLRDGVGPIGIRNARHQQTQLLFIRFLRQAFAHDLSVEHHGDAVRQCQDLFQFDGHKQDRLATVAQRHDLLVDEFDCTNVHAARGLPDQQQVGIALDFAGQHDLLLVAARKVLGRKTRVRGPDVKAFHLACGILADRGVVHKPASAIGRVVVIAEGGVLPSLIIHDQTFTLAVLRHMGDPARPARLSVGPGARGVQRLAVQMNPAGAGLVSAQHFEQFGLPVTRDTRDAQHLARAHLKVDPPQPFHTLVVHDAQVFHVEHDVTRGGGGLVHPQQHLAPDHQFGQFGGLGFGGLYRGRHFAPPHDADGIGDFHDLAQLVGDQDDGFAFGAKPPENAEKLVGLCRGQNARRLVEDQDIGPAVERLEDLHPLLHSHADVLHQRIRVHLEAVVVRQFDQALAGLGERGFQQAPVFGPQNDILEHREIFHQLEMLEYHADPGCDGCLAVGDVGLAPADEDLALVGLVEAVKDRHQRRFSGTVFTDDAVDRTGLHPDRNILVRLNRAESLGNTLQFNGRGSRFRLPRCLRWCHDQKLRSGQLSSDM